MLPRLSASDLRQQVNLIKTKRRTTPANAPIEEYTSIYHCAVSG